MSLTGDTFDFQQGNVVTSSAQLVDNAATVGDVLTVQTDKSIAAAPGGGSQPFAGAVVRLAAGATPVAHQATIPFDTVMQDTAAYWDPSPNFQFVFPAGVYSVSGRVWLAATVGLTAARIVAYTSGDTPNIETAFAEYGGEFYVAFSGVIVSSGGPAAVGFELDLEGAASADVHGGGNGSYVSLVSLGSLP